MVASPVGPTGFAETNRAAVAVSPQSAAVGCPSVRVADNEGFVSAYDIGATPRPWPYDVEVWFQ
jgi:hypothetical protein